MKRFLAAILLLAPAWPVSAKGIKGTKHDLSRTGPGPTRAVSERDMCVFCHVTHRATGRGTGRPDFTGAILPYRSSTMAVQTPDKPTGTTAVCLSCHDGTIALGQTRRRSIPMNAAAQGRMAPGPALLGRDLRGTHPVSFPVKETARVHDPKDQSGRVRLDPRGELQCTACHDPHEEFVDPEHGKFLAMTTQRSALCIACHSAVVYRPAGATHAFSDLVPPPGILATANKTDQSLAAAGCLACHPQHGAQPGSRLLKPAPADDKRCLVCHDGRVVSPDLGRQTDKPFAHASAPGDSGHDAGEGPGSAAFRLPEVSPSSKRHATCVDCHNPHQSTTAATATAAIAATSPRVMGALRGSWGIDRNGRKIDPVQFEYEVCFKCHADSQNQPQARGPTPGRTVIRALTEVNLRRVFDPGSPSFHPVVGPGRNPKVPSLIRPRYTEASQIYCSDCHASDGASTAQGVPRGPHGSVYPYLLERNYSTADGTVESAEAYALCYKCHDRDKVLSTETTFSRQAPASPQRESLHRRHLQVGATCSACHNAHGISAIAGNAVNNAHLVDFDVSVVGATPTGIRRYQSGGVGAGSCTLTCHGVQHDPALDAPRWSYAP